MRKTPQEVAAEIAALEAIKPYVPKHSCFGNDNHKQIDVQIEELREGVDDTAEEWGDLTTEEQDAVFEARNWKSGESDESPSSGWSSFKPAPPKTKEKKK